MSEAKTEHSLDFRNSEEDFRRIARTANWMIAAAAALTAISSVLTGPQAETERLINIFTFLATAVLSEIALHRNPRAAVVVLSVGLWLANSITMWRFGGIYSANTVVYPFLIALSGWMLGRSWLIGLTILTCLFMTLLGVAEHLGIHLAQPRPPALIATTTVIVTLIVSFFLTNRAYTSQANTNARVQETSEALAIHNIALAQREAEVQELNTTLEQRVEQRTVELAKAMETLQMAQDELRESEAKVAIAAMVASVTHEINTPLGNAVMASSTLKDHATSFLANVEAGHLKRSELTAFLQALKDGSDLIQRNLMRAEGLLKNFKQVAADQVSEQRRQFDLSAMLSEVLQLLAPTLKRHPQQIELDLPPDIAMDSYPGPLGQVMINLINNAYLHAFDGRSTGTLRIQAAADLQQVTLTISDDGIGMSTETMTNLFQPFFSTKIGHGGTGLGMTIVEGIVRKTLGGSLHIDSVPGVGTTVRLVLPRVAPDNTSTTVTTPS